MRKSPTITRSETCHKCGTMFNPTSNRQFYCPPCKVAEDKARKQRWYAKNNPGAYSVKPERYCVACGEKAASSINGTFYCNKHYQKIHSHGTLDYVRKSKNTFEVCGNVVKITTNKAQVILVDGEYFPVVSKHSWCVSKNGYAVARIGGKLTRLHRYLFNPPSDVVMDHRDGNKLDCRKQNLRLCENTLNSRNSKIKRNNTSGYPGINKFADGKYRVRITVNRKELNIGRFSTLSDAIDARIAAELKHYGSFAPSLGVLKDLLGK
jgi:hypothetical protein